MYKSLVRLCVFISLLLGSILVLAAPQEEETQSNSDNLLINGNPNDDPIVLYCEPYPECLIWPEEPPADDSSNGDEDPPPGS
ncbi:hypothetical protein [Aliikangiella sp. G2MR2-5]|uniref:hypothetical protein n=1 Tax=Aliikangiella sp. G2MR2-5 TaxID=2788943 RepID=UPI0018AB9BDB|nr:hypothetical protein [Aliikangiella sp. G2MR2-5]